MAEKIITTVKLPICREKIYRDTFLHKCLKINIMKNQKVTKAAQKLLARFFAYDSL